MSCVWKLGLLSDCVRDLRKRVGLPQGSEVSFCIVKNAGLLSSQGRGMGDHLSFMGESRGVSLVVVGSFEFLSSWDGDFRECFMLPQGHQASFHVARGTLEFLWNCCKGIGLHLNLRQETKGPSSVGTVILGFLSSFIREVRHQHALNCGNLVSC